MAKDTPKRTSRGSEKRDLVKLSIVRDLDGLTLLSRQARPLFKFVGAYYVPGCASLKGGRQLQDLTPGALICEAHDFRTLRSKIKADTRNIWPLLICTSDQPLPVTLIDNLPRFGKGTDEYYSAAFERAAGQPISQPSSRRVVKAIKTGLAFEGGWKKRRQDALSKLMISAYRDFQARKERVPTARELWNHLPVIDPQRKIVADCEEDFLTWVRSPNNEDLQELRFHDFQKRLTRLRKKIRENKIPTLD